MEHRANWTDIVVNISQMTQLGFDHTCQTFRSLDVQSMFAASFWLWVFNANRRQKYSNLILRLYVSLKFSWNWKSISADPDCSTTFTSVNISPSCSVEMNSNYREISMEAVAKAVLPYLLPRDVLNLSMVSRDFHDVKGISENFETAFIDLNSTGFWFKHSMENTFRSLLRYSSTRRLWFRRNRLEDVLCKFVAAIPRWLGSASEIL